MPTNNLPSRRLRYVLPRNEILATFLSAITAKSVSKTVVYDTFGESEIVKMFQYNSNDAA